jgi:hypothetical protein
MSSVGPLYGLPHMWGSGPGRKPCARCNRRPRNFFRRPGQMCPRSTPLAGVEYPVALTWPKVSGPPVLPHEYPTSGVAAG